MGTAPRFLAAILAAGLVTVGCGFDHGASSTTSPTPASGGSSGGASSSAMSLAGIWMSNALPAGVPDKASCGNFQFEATSQTATSVTGTFMGQCGGGLVLSGHASGQLNGDEATIQVKGSGIGLPGIPSCTFDLTAHGTVQDGGYTLPLSYSGTTCLGPVHGTETLRRPQPQAAPPPPPPPPPPAPEPTPPPRPTPSNGDMIDMRAVKVYGGSAPDISNWAVTAGITGLDFRGSGVRVDFTKKTGGGRWPDVVPPGWDGPLQYTIWMVVNHGGQWVTSGGVEYWYGLEYQGGPPSRYASNWYYSPAIWGPLASHQPYPGEQVGFFVSAGDQRAKDITLVRERSNVVVIPFPSDAGGSFGF
jgi:hypothetical protein